MVDERQQADRRGDEEAANHRPRRLRTAAHKARDQEAGGDRPDGAQRNEQPRAAFRIGVVREKQGVERDRKREGKGRDVGAHDRIQDDRLAQQRPVSREHAAARAGSRARRAMRAESEQEGYEGARGKQGKGGAKAGGGEQEARERRSEDLPDVSHRVQAPELNASRSRQLARHRPVRRPERRSREHQRKLADQQHAETVGKGEPDGGEPLGPARAEHQSPPADAVGIRAADEIERRLGEHRRREQEADLGVGQTLAVRVQGHGKPSHAEAEIPCPRRQEEVRMPEHARLWLPARKARFGISTEGQCEPSWAC